MSPYTPEELRVQAVQMMKQMEERITELEAERDQLADKMERAMIAVAHFTHSYNQDLETIKALRKALDDAPHGNECRTLWKSDWRDVCDCWKAQIQKGKE